MQKLAVALWLITAASGLHMFALTLRTAAPESEAEGSRLAFPMFVHPSGAVLGFAFLLVFVDGGPVVSGWLALGVLVATVVLGELIFLRWVRERRRLEHPEQVAEQQIPGPAILTHGVVALATVATVLVAVLQD